MQPPRRMLACSIFTTMRIIIFSLFTYFCTLLNLAQGTFGNETGAMSLDVCSHCPLGTYSEKEGVGAEEDCKPCPTGRVSNIKIEIM